MIEVMVALLVFSTAMTGMLATQLAGKQSAAEALQRSTATLLAQDMLERIRSNPGQAESYANAGLGDVDSPQPLPDRDCAQQDCSPGQLARYDLWHWESLLTGLTEARGSRRVGDRDGAITLSLNWLGTSASPTGGEGVCAIGTPGLYDDLSQPAGNNLRRRVLTIATAIERFAS
jgi:type IV pilus assembly protein PilV